MNPGSCTAWSSVKKGNRIDTLRSLHGDEDTWAEAETYAHADGLDSRAVVRVAGLSLPFSKNRLVASRKNVWVLRVYL